MALEDQVVPIAFGQGIQTKTDSKQTPIGNQLVLENAIFTKAKAVNKRNGYTKLTKNIVGGGTLSSSPNMISELNDELVCADGGQLYAYNESINAWNNRGAYDSLKTQIYPIHRTNASTQSASSIGENAARLNNYALYTWGSVAAGGVGVFATAIDLNNQDKIITDRLLYSGTGATAGRQAAPVCLAGTQLAVIGIAIARNPVISLLTISPPTTLSFSAPTLINSNTVDAARVLVAKQTTTGAVVGYFTSSTSLTLLTVNSSGVQVNITTISGTGMGHALSVYPDAVTGNIWVYWVDNTSIKYAIYSSTLASVLSATTISTSADYASGISSPLTLVANPTSSTTQTLYFGYLPFSEYATPTVQPESGNVTKTVQLTSSGSVGTVTVFKKDIIPISEVFTLGSTTYCAFCYNSNTQSSVFLVRLSDGAFMGRCLSGRAAGIATIGFINAANALTYDNKVWIPAQTFVSSGFGVLYQPTVISYETGNIDCFQSTHANDTLVLNGSQLFGYDNAAVTEIGFFQAPQIFKTTAVGSGGSLSAGTYIYYTTFEWEDNNGNLYVSAPSVAATVTTVANDSVLLYVTLPWTSNKSGVKVVLYRTLVNGTIPHYAATLVADVTASGPYYLTFTDIFADITIAQSTILYTTGGVLDNNAPPPSTTMVVKNNRLWIVSDETKNEVWYTKTFIPGGGVNFSGFLLENVDISGNQIKALAQMDDKIIYMTETDVYYTSGDGANDTGQGSTLSLPQNVPSDTGCSQSSGVITFPSGVMTKTPKGLYLLDRALNFQYFGAPMEDYNSQTIRSTNVIKTKTQIRFLCDDGVLLLFDYVFGQWSVFTNHEGVSATVWEGNYTYLRTDGEIYVESDGYYLDNTTAFSLKVQTAWLDFGTIQGFERLKQFLLLGDYVGGGSHGIQTTIGYDYIDSTVLTVDPFYFVDASPFQFRTFFPFQKCESASLIIEEIVTGVSTESVVFTDMSVLVGVKKGLNKIKAASSVG